METGYLVISMLANVFFFVCIFIQHEALCNARDNEERMVNLVQRYQVWAKRVQEKHYD
jgi:hypothetical protein